jgi:hypothetical protein
VANNNRLKDASRALPKLNAFHSSDAASEPELQAILREMRAPLADTGMDLAGVVDVLPPPLSAIITPRVTEHEGNNSVSVPRYFGTTPVMSTAVSKPRMVGGSQQQQPQEASTLLQDFFFFKANRLYSAHSSSSWRTAWTNNVH